MTDLPEKDPLTIPQIVSAKGREKLAMLTVYDAPSARLLDEAGIEILLVGDSVEMTVYGEPNTLSATMDTMIRHTRAVSRSVRRAVVVGDMPFLSYQTDPANAVANAGRFLAEGGAAAVKVEGGRRILPAVEAILAADIPVMGHVGLTPQSYRKFGGFKVQGREADSAREIREDAKALADAGCFAIVLECVPETLAAEITHEIAVPTLGIGAGAPLRRPGPRLPRRRRPDARPAAQVRAALRRPLDRDRGRRARLRQGRQERVLPVPRRVLHGRPAPGVAPGPLRRAGSRARLTGAEESQHDLVEPGRVFQLEGVRRPGKDLELASAACTCEALPPRSGRVSSVFAPSTKSVGAWIRRASSQVNDCRRVAGRRCGRLHLSRQVLQENLTELRRKLRRKRSPADDGVGQDAGGTLDVAVLKQPSRLFERKRRHQRLRFGVVQRSIESSHGLRQDQAPHQSGMIAARRAGRVRHRPNGRSGARAPD